MEVVLSSWAAPLNIVIPKLPIKSPKRPFKNLVSYIPTLKFPENTSNFSTPIRSRSTVCSCFSLKLSTNIPSPVSCSSSSKRTSAASTAATTTAAAAAATTTTSLSSTTRAHQRHWIVVVEPPKQDLNSKPEIIDYYVKTLERVLSSERDAQMCIYDASCDTHFGFCCDIDQEMANELARVDGVISVKPDLDFNSLEKDYSCSKVQSSLSTGSYASSSLLFPAGNTKHWLVRMDKPSTGLVSKAKIVDYFVQTLTKVMGNERDAQMCIYHASWQPDCGFCCELDEECARELAGMAGVLAVQQDENFESDSKDFGAAIQPTNIDTKKLFITGLSFYTSEKTLRAAFDGFGELVEVKVIMDKISKRSKGYAFVEYSTEEAASMALKEMNGKIINGWMIVVDYAKSTLKYGRGRRRPAS